MTILLAENQAGLDGIIINNDSKINDLNRQIIMALKKSAGAAFIGNINHYSPDTATILKEYTGQFIYNFGCDFCIPSFDEPLVGLIMEWNQTNKILLKKYIEASDRIGYTIFVDCSEIPSIPQHYSASLDYQTIEAIVNKILQSKSNHASL